MSSTARSLSAFAALLVLITGLIGLAYWPRSGQDQVLVGTAHKGTLTAQLTVRGTLRPAESVTYRSPLGGREAEIAELVPEGTRVAEGDLLVRLDTTELEFDIERVRQELRQIQTEVQIAEIERQDAEDDVRSVAEGEGAVTAEETRTRFLLAQKKVERLRQEVRSLRPLFDRGFITREELRRTSDELEQAEEELALAKKRSDVFADVTRPQDTQRARLKLAQKRSQLEIARTRLAEVQSRLAVLLRQVDECRLYARQPGMVVYEEFLGVFPRRKIHVGDRVTGSQGLVTIPDVNRMLLDTSLSEAEMHRVHAGQRAVVRPEAFADARLPATVVRVGSLARSSVDRPFDDKRFDLVIHLDSTTVDLRPEMSARAEILVGTREDVLLVPVKAVFEAHGRFVARVLGRSGLETRPVDLGESNDAFVEVIAGLREGERVALTAPAP